ncbi:site-2 protease family protein [Desulfovibrio sp. OttesenSCG-928-A18]|nr:site-2 protease family protein [Desulfovibrio sp. OttesenSCG-928-A18]
MFDIDSVRLLIFGLAIVPAIFGIIMHEVAHGWVAFKHGDPTAKFLGRLTLNPIRHVDPMGLGVFIFTALFSPFIIGWAKPVPVQPRYFKKPRQAMMLVSAAGPITNFIVALFCALLARAMANMMDAGLVGGSSAVGMVNSFLRYGFQGPQDIAVLVLLSAILGIFINCALAWFNLMPVPPLDGSHILEGLLPRSLAIQYASLGRFGMLIIILLVAVGAFRYVLVPLIDMSASFMLSFTGIDPAISRRFF